MYQKKTTTNPPTRANTRLFKKTNCFNLFMNNLFMNKRFNLFMNKLFQSVYEQTVSICL